MRTAEGQAGVGALAMAMAAEASTAWEALGLFLLVEAMEEKEEAMGGAW